MSVTVLEPTAIGASFGATVERLRRRASFSQSELARRTGIDRAYVHRVEKAPPTAPVIPSRSVVLAMAIALNLAPCDADALLVTAGYAPRAIMSAVGWCAEFAALADFLNDPNLSEPDRVAFGRVLRELMAHWRGKVR